MLSEEEFDAAMTELDLRQLRGERMERRAYNAWRKVSSSFGQIERAAWKAYLHAAHRDAEITGEVEHEKRLLRMAQKS